MSRRLFRVPGVGEANLRLTLVADDDDDDDPLVVGFLVGLLIKSSAGSLSSGG